MTSRHSLRQVRASAAAFAIGARGQMYRTTDSGNTWTSVASGTTADLYAGAGVPTGPAWVVGAGGTIVRSGDGTNWTPVASGTTADLTSIAELDLTNLYVAGAKGTILRSTDLRRPKCREACRRSRSTRAIGRRGSTWSACGPRAWRRCVDSSSGRRISDRERPPRLLL